MKVLEMRVLGWAVFALAALLLILFAVSNREMVSVGLWPLPAFVELPLYLVVLGTLLLGFIMGQLVTWIGGWRRRREARRARDRVAILEQELELARVRPADARVPVPAIAR
jgi:uncharacterized integral membrane protein